jgi:hypothetical protein
MAGKGRSERVIGKICCYHAFKQLEIGAEFAKVINLLGEPFEKRTGPFDLRERW